MKGDDIKRLQIYLNAKGYVYANKDLIADGIFGLRLKYSVIILQKKYNLFADGVVGTATRKVINGL